MNKILNKYLKNTKGITLVALVITIIILLILAGISIAQLTGNGLFEKAKETKEKTGNAQIEEDITLGKYENGIDEYINNSRAENGSFYCLSFTSPADGSWTEYDLPEGYTAENCMVVGYQCYYPSYGFYYSNYNYQDSVVVTLTSNNKIKVIIGDSKFRNQNMKVLLYKINN